MYIYIFYFLCIVYIPKQFKYLSRIKNYFIFGFHFKIKACAELEVHYKN